VSSVVDEVKETDVWIIGHQQKKKPVKSRYGCEIMIENGSYADVCTKRST
jgi:hypothetical protein